MLAVMRWSPGKHIFTDVGDGSEVVCGIAVVLDSVLPVGKQFFYISVIRFDGKLVLACLAN